MEKMIMDIGKWTEAKARKAMANGATEEEAIRLAVRLLRELLESRS